MDSDRAACIAHLRFPGSARVRIGSKDYNMEAGRLVVISYQTGEVSMAWTDLK